MEKFLNKGHHGVIGKIFSLDVETYRLSILKNVQKIINNHSKVFGEMPKDLPLTQDHDHDIHLQL